MIGATELAQMKPSAVLINVGRGPIIDEQALIAALKSGAIAGAGLDVFEKEPLPEDSPLWEMENVIVTPHFSAGSDNYTNRVADIVCDNLRRYLAGQPLRNMVNLDLGY
jgi:phosphoglycerate dehydrogenase-like enzyme